MTNKQAAKLVRAVRLDVLAMSQQKFAEFLQMPSGDRTIYNWENEVTKVPGPVIVLCEILLAKSQEAAVPPKRP